MAQGFPPLPTPDQPLFDPDTLKMNKVWYVYFRALDKKLRELAEG